MTAIDELITTYLLSCEVEGKSPYTLRSYGDSLRKFREVGARIGLPDEVEAYTLQHVYAYLAALRGTKPEATYQHRMHREARTFFSWCRRMDFIGQNVFARVPPIKLEQKIVQPFTAKQISTLLAATDRSTRRGCRDHALILFLLDTGVRASECVSVRLDDIDWERGRIRILHGKGRKQRLVGIGERALQALRDYVDRFRGEEPGPMFQSSRLAEPLTRGALSQLITRLGEQAGVEHVHPHRFRHTFATWAIRSHAREVDVQRLLGHSSLQMVQRYSATYSSDEAVEAHGAFSPVAQLSDYQAGSSAAPRPSAAGPRQRAPEGTQRLSPARTATQ